VKIKVKAKKIRSGKINIKSKPFAGLLFSFLLEGSVDTIM
jgi:hypothetical protein